MNVVVDTNVLISGVFFGGLPARVLEAWRDGRIRLVVSAELIEEYRRVGERLADQFEGVSLGPFLALLETHAEIVDPVPLPRPVSRDPEDDMSIACAVAGGCASLISGDHDLLEVGTYGTIKIVTPRRFLETVLR